MRFGGRRPSDNVEFREGGGSRFGFGGGGGGGAMLLGLVFSRFGIGGVVVLLIVMALFGGLGGLTGGGQQAVGPQAGRSSERNFASARDVDARALGPDRRGIVRDRRHHHLLARFLAQREIRAP